MSNNDTFSTLVESYHLNADIDQFRTHLDRWISNGGKPTPNDKFEASYHQLIGSAKNLNEAERLEHLTKFRKYLQTLPVVELTLAFEPDAGFKEQIRKKLTSQVKGDFMVKFLVNKEIIAGCLINFNGKFADHSLLKTLDDNQESIFGEILSQMRG